MRLRSRGCRLLRAETYGCPLPDSMSTARTSGARDGPLFPVTRDASNRPMHVATALKPYAGTAPTRSRGLSSTRNRHYSFVVKTTGSAPPLADPETDQLIIQ